MTPEEFDGRVELYLMELTKVRTVDDLLKVVRDAAEWGLGAHRREVEMRAKLRRSSRP